MAEALKGLRQQGIGVINDLLSFFFFADSAEILNQSWHKHVLSTKPGVDNTYRKIAADPKPEGSMFRLCAGPQNNQNLPD